MGSGKSEAEGCEASEAIRNYFPSDFRLPTSSLPSWLTAGSRSVGSIFNLQSSIDSPAFNDSSEVNLRGSASTYELAFARYREQRYVSLLTTGNRQNDFALWFGEDELPEAPAIQWQSDNYQRSGYAILARGKSEQATWLCLKYGPHGGGHGHPDKLNFVLYARGQVIASDPGTARYGLPIQGGWYRTTLAHNTLTVDETSQKPSEGKCIAFGQVEQTVRFADCFVPRNRLRLTVSLLKVKIDFAIADAGDIYDGVRLVRTAALLSENLLVFVDQIHCDRERLLDTVYHNSGVWDTLPDGITWTPPDKDGYRYLRDTTVRQVTPLENSTLLNSESNEVKFSNGVSESSTLTARVRDDWRIAITLAGGNPPSPALVKGETEIITGTGVGAHLEDRVPLALFRRRAKETALAWCVAVDGKAVQIEWLSVRDSNGDAISRTIAAAVQVITADGQV